MDIHSFRQLNENILILFTLKDYFISFSREKFGETLESISQSVVDEVKVVQKPIIGLSDCRELDVIAMAQLTEGHIWAVDMVHDGQKFLIGCGSENGEIGLWRPGLDKPVRMRIHNKSITGK